MIIKLSIRSKMLASGLECQSFLRIRTKCLLTFTNRCSLFHSMPGTQVKAWRCPAAVHRARCPAAVHPARCPSAVHPARCPAAVHPARCLPPYTVQNISSCRSILSIGTLKKTVDALHYWLLRAWNAAFDIYTNSSISITRNSMMMSSLFIQPV